MGLGLDELLLERQAGTNSAAQAAFSTSTLVLSIQSERQALSEWNCIEIFSLDHNFTSSSPFQPKHQYLIEFRSHFNKEKIKGR